MNWQIKMEVIFLKLKFSIFLFFIFFSFNLFAIELIIAKKDIAYNELLTPNDLVLIDQKEAPLNCVPLKLEELKNNNYKTSKFIKEKKVLCKEDLKKDIKKSIIFRFGSIEIETNGKIMYENDEYIKIKKENGKIEKIYKDGRTR